MTLLGRRTTLYMLLCLVILSVVLRYPLIEHERHQTDSYYIHQLSDSVIDEGYARWIIHPLSLFGYYPLSYPSGAPFLFAESSTLTGLSVEASILLGNMLFSILFCLSAFLFARQFFDRSGPALLSVFFIITGARFVDTSYWNGSARAILVIFAIMVIFVLLRSATFPGDGQRKLIAVAICFIFACLCFHHMAVLLTVLGVAYLLSAFQIQFVCRMIRTRRAKAIAAFNVSVGIAVVLTGFVIVDFLGELVFTNLRSTSLFDFEPAILSVLLNMGGVYIKQIGFIAIVAVTGIPFLMKIRHSDYRYLFLMAVLLAFIPLLGNTLYVSMALSPFVAVVGVMFISEIGRPKSNRRRRNAAYILSIILMISSLGLTYWTIEGWNSKEYTSGDTVEVDSQVFNDASYLTLIAYRDYVISNNYVASLQLSALSDAHFVDSETGLVLSGDMDPDDLRGNVTWSEEPFPRNLYVWFSYTNEPNVNYFIFGFFTGGADFLFGPSPYLPALEFFGARSSLYVVIDNDHSSSFVNAYFVRSAVLPNQLLDSFCEYSANSINDVTLDSYLTYNSSGISVYAVRLASY